MSREKELIKNTIIIGIGNFSTKILSFFLLPLYTAILTTAEYGTYELITTVNVFLIPIITMLMEESMFRFLVDCKSEEEKKSIITQSIIYIMISTVIFTSIYIIVSMIFNIQDSIYIYLFIFTSLLSTVKNGVARGMSNIKLYTISNLISSIIMIVLNILFIAVFRMGVEGLLLSVIIANVVSSIYVFIRIKIFNLISFNLFDKNKLKEMMKYSIPLVPNSISWAVINLSDRIVISSTLGISQNGIYAISYKFPTLMDTIYSFFYTSWKENAAKTIGDKDSNEYYQKINDVLKTFMWAVVIMMICVLPFVFNLLIGSEFGESYMYIPILVLSMYFSNISGFFGGIFSAHKKTKIMGITTVIAAVINIIINIICIRYIGLWAAAISTLISTLIVYIIRSISIKKYVKFKRNTKLLISMIVSFIASIYMYYAENIYIQIIMFLLISIYAIYINRELLQVIHKNIMQVKNKITKTRI